MVNVDKLEPGEFFTIQTFPHNIYIKIDPIPIPTPNDKYKLKDKYTCCFFKDADIVGFEQGNTEFCMGIWSGINTSPIRLLDVKELSDAERYHIGYLIRRALKEGIGRIEFK